MQSSVGDAARKLENCVVVELASRLNAAINPTQKKRNTRRFLVASWSGEVCPGTCEAGTPNTSLQGRTCGGPWTDLSGLRRGHRKNFRKLRFDPDFGLPGSRRGHRKNF